MLSFNIKIIEMNKQFQWAFDNKPFQLIKVTNYFSFVTIMAIEIDNLFYH